MHDDWSNKTLRAQYTAKKCPAAGAGPCDKAVEGTCTGGDCTYPPKCDGADQPACKDKTKGTCDAGTCTYPDKCPANPTPANTCKKSDSGTCQADGSCGYTNKPENSPCDGVPSCAMRLLCVPALCSVCRRCHVAFRSKLTQVDPSSYEHATAYARTSGIR